MRRERFEAVAFGLMVWLGVFVVFVGAPGFVAWRVLT